MRLSRYSSSALLLLLLLSSNGLGFANGQDAACGDAVEESASLATFAMMKRAELVRTLAHLFFAICTIRVPVSPSMRTRWATSSSMILPWLWGSAFSAVSGGACEDTTPLSILFERDDILCEDWLAVNSFKTFTSCTDECTDSCKRVIDEVYSTCEATDEKTDDLFSNDDDYLDDAIGDDFFVTTAEEAEQTASQWRHEDCNAYADGLEWKTEGAVEVLTTTSSPTTPSVSIPPLNTISPVPTPPPTASSVSIPPSAHSTSASASLSSSMWGLIFASSMFIGCLVVW